MSEIFILSVSMLIKKVRTRLYAVQRQLERATRVQSLFGLSTCANLGAGLRKREMSPWLKSRLAVCAGVH
jgi:hypothetical protein